MRHHPQLHAGTSVQKMLWVTTTLATIAMFYSPEPKPQMFLRRVDPAVLITRGRRVLGWPWQFPQQPGLHVHSGRGCELDGATVQKNGNSTSVISVSKVSVHIRQALFDQPGSDATGIFSHLTGQSKEARKGKLTRPVSHQGKCETNNESFAKDAWRAGGIVKGWLMDPVTFISELTSLREIQLLASYTIQ